MSRRFEDIEFYTPSGELLQNLRDNAENLYFYVPRKDGGLCACHPKDADCFDMYRYKQNRFGVGRVAPISAMEFLNFAFVVGEGKRYIGTRSLFSGISSPKLQGFIKNLSFIREKRALPKTAVVSGAVPRHRQWPDPGEHLHAGVSKTPPTPTPLESMSLEGSGVSSAMNISYSVELTLTAHPDYASYDVEKLYQGISPVSYLPILAPWDEKALGSHPGELEFDLPYVLSCSHRDYRFFLCDTGEKIDNQDLALVGGGRVIEPGEKIRVALQSTTQANSTCVRVKEATMIAKVHLVRCIDPTLTFK